MQRNENAKDKNNLESSKDLKPKMEQLTFSGSYHHML